jgi:cell division septation protein DedD
MNNFQHGIYQPAADKVPFYDLADEDPEEERPRVPLLVVIALVMLAAFAGVVWLAYTGASLAITALERPVRVATPEAAPAPTGLNGYNEPVSPEQEAKTSPPAPQSAAKAEPPPTQLNQVAPPPRPAQAARAEPPPIRLSQAPPPAPAKAAKAATPRAPSAAASAAASRAVSGAAVLQLGAFDSQQLANGAWARFRARYPSFAGLSRDIQRTDLGKKGIMYRLRVGPFANRAAATNACIQLKAAGANCFVAAP